MYSIIYQAEAENDLLDILAYYHAQGGFELATIINERIRNHIAKLQTFPYRTRESHDFENAREFLIAKLPYKAYLRIDETSKTIFIFNIVHFARKFPN